MHSGFLIWKSQFVSKKFFIKFFENLAIGYLSPKAQNPGTVLEICPNSPNDLCPMGQLWDSENS